MYSKYVPFLRVSLEFKKEWSYKGMNLKTDEFTMHFYNLERVNKGKK